MANPRGIGSDNPKNRVRTRLGHGVELGQHFTDRRHRNHGFARGESPKTHGGLNVSGRVFQRDLDEHNAIGIPAVVQYKGGVYGTVAGLMQVNVQIPPGVTPGGYVPVVLTVGTASTVDGAVWIAVSN